MNDDEEDDRLRLCDYSAVTSVAVSITRHKERILEEVSSILSAPHDVDAARRTLGKIVTRVEVMANNSVQCASLNANTIRRRFGDDRVLELREEAIKRAEAHVQSFNAQEESALSDDEDDDEGDDDDGESVDTVTSPPGTRGQRNKGGNNGRGKRKRGTSNNERQRKKKCSKPNGDEESNSSRNSTDGDDDSSNCSSTTLDRSKLLLEGKRVLEEVKSQLASGHKIAVTEWRFVDIALVQLEDALDPQHFDHQRVQSISKCLLAIVQNLQQYKKLIAVAGLADAEEYMESVKDHDDDTPIGTILLGVEKSMKMAEDAKKGKKGKSSAKLIAQLSELYAALQHYKSGVDSPAAFDIEKDIASLKDLVALDNATSNVLTSSSHLSMNVHFESRITLGELYMHHKEKKEYLERAEDLWMKVQPGVPFDETKVTMLDYKLKVLSSALATKELEGAALVVANEMKSKTTDFRVAGQADILLPAWQESQMETIAGRSFEGERKSDLTLPPEEDYSGSRSKAAGERRGRMTCLGADMLLQDNIAERLPEDLFPDGLVRTLLLNSASFTKRCCSFLNPNDLSFFDKRLHDHDSAIVKKIKKERKEYNTGGRKLIVDKKTLGAMKQLLEL